MNEHSAYRLRDEILARIQLATMTDAEEPAFSVGVVAHGEESRVSVHIQQTTPTTEELTDAIAGIANGEVEVVTVGRVHGLENWQRERVRPLRIGSSCAHPLIGRGTIGCFVRDLKNGGRLLLSNNHVIAAEGLAEPADAIEQPGRFDQVGSENYAVAAYVRCVELTKTGNLVDCAVAAVTTDYDERLLEGIGQLQGLRTKPLRTNDVVHKIGRTTGLRKGIIDSVGHKGVCVQLRRGDFYFDEQIAIRSDGEPFAEEGDSGALVFDDDHLAVGLLFAGNEATTITYANPIATVFQKLKVRL